ncbi:unnamed protein product [Penicillium salamii]|uniref:Aminotransferase class I/classII large domain-containing protein n=1 Tax=Penicillium salamii TaxID=1612424 RepID=A0A9W4JDE2_9EURO|nr:unnamed protein product [Penicillium salamii]CAG7974046.1 unnamed protein product [Penicillium salamii]CAG8032029.1 unnamed protein product [Penicillium salamii]CAG8059765.1 unnamed protein product [Penicillium salamii]CAG8100413.1 unnamed protein product [Penicillium salamii]
MYPTTQIDLFKGQPAISMLPVNRLKQASSAALSDKTIFGTGLEYGPNEGHLPMRKNMAKWLTKFYNPSQPIPTDRVCITGGASQNLACILQVFTDPAQTKMIWLVEPTYHLGFRIFEDAGFMGRLRGIPEDEDGMDVAALERALEAFEQEHQTHNDTVYKTERPHGKMYKHVIYCVPTFSNPSGRTMPRARRGYLVRVARKFDALVVADDVYDFLTWGNAHSGDSSLARLVDIDRVLDDGPREFGNVVSNGSFSKLIGPGCRVGWAEGTSRFIHGLSEAGSTRSGGAASQLMSTFVNEMLEDNFLPEYIRDTLIPEGRKRHTLLASAVKAHLGPFGVTFAPDPETSALVGGYFIWLRLPDTLTSTQVCEWALRTQNLVLASGETFAVPGGDFSAELHHRLRLCFMCEDEGRLVEGVERLGLVIQDILGNDQNQG